MVAPSLATESSLRSHFSNFGQVVDFQCVGSLKGLGVYSIRFSTGGACEDAKKIYKQEVSAVGEVLTGHLDAGDADLFDRCYRAPWSAKVKILAHISPESLTKSVLLEDVPFLKFKEDYESLLKELKKFGEIENVCTIPYTCGNVFSLVCVTYKNKVSDKIVKDICSGITFKDTQLRAKLVNGEWAKEKGAQRTMRHKALLCNVHAKQKEKMKEYISRLHGRSEFPTPHHLQQDFATRFKEGASFRRIADYFEDHHKAGYLDPVLNHAL